MSFGKLYGPIDGPRSIPILVTAKANQIDLELVETEGNSSAAFNQSPEYTKFNPLGKVPTFVDANGFVLTEAIAIAIYVTSQNEKTTLLGKTKQDYASILRWMSYANHELLPRLGDWYRPLIGKDPYNKKAVDDSSKTALKNLSVLETHLTANTYLVGERLTLADIFAAGLLTRAFSLVLDKEFRSKNVAVTRWYQTVINQPVFKAIFPNPVFAEEVVKYTPQKKEAKPEKPKQPKQQPKQEKAKPKPDVVDDEEDDEPKPEPKPKHPLEALGKPNLILDDWKRKYSNEDTRPVAMPWFWEHLTPDEYSLWRVDYKYNDELKLTFMSNNLIGGFFARLEGSRKYLFGAASVYGQNSDSIIRGAFLVRGQDHLAAFDVAPDWESYAFTKLDHTKEEDRKLIADLWAWDVPIVENDKEYPWVDGHVFK